MAFIHKKPNADIWYLIDKSRKPSWIQLGRITRAEAKKCLHKYETDTTYLRLGLPLPPTKITFREMADEYLDSVRGIKGGYTFDRLEYLFSHFCQTFGDRFIGTLQARELEEYMTEKEYKARTWRDLTISLKNVYKLAVSRKYLPENPIDKVRLLKIGRSIPKFVDPGLLDQVIACMDGPVKVYYSILRYTGMRPGEALRLKVKNIREISYDQKGTRVVRSVFLFHSPKTGADRVVGIHPELMPILKKFIEGEKEKGKKTKPKKAEDYLFPAKEGKGHQQSMKKGLQRVIAKREEEIEKKKIEGPSFKGISMYTFRHSVATDMLAKTGDIRAVQSVLGHSKTSTTEIYAHALDAAKIHAIEVL